jgi:hypothetical protein
MIFFLTILKQKLICGTILSNVLALTMDAVTKA